ncbi:MULTISPECIES: ATP-binding protein [unclassified Flavobacterium]|uniref:sensor histidine kinase n=1 Tax=unclassified Flavobacterium TaxID=196869 RepID=UPI000AFFA866|nr:MULTISPECIES: ATP-binding protein [unclassified Flavobacterium]MBN9285551.1 ATP-binding protein [Flavobacterium sp.]
MDNQKEIKILKQQLTAEVQKEHSDNSLILSLSNRIARLATTEVRFSVDAGIINRLGKELVGRHETAVSELVKNAYDADAKTVNLIFKDAWNPGGTLIIDDDGIGMNREELINGFMRLSSSDKIHNPESPKYNRTRAGRKGIGRFATQRLGNKLTIITQKENLDSALKITIDWNRFETDRDLASISNSIEIIPKKKEEGTTLIIEDLREGWSDPTIKRVYRYTSDLLQPFPLSKERKEKIENKLDPGFKSSYYRDIESEENLIIDEEEAFLKYALAEIEGYVLEDGQGCWSLESEKLEFSQEVFLIGKNKDLPESKFQFIKGIHFKCYYFLYDSSLIPTQTMTFIREVANERGGIRIYRNGFRVLPYGEKLNDWLGLDDSTARRVILSSHRNINFFGFVEITDESGLLFDETSSREGLFDNEAFQELVGFVQRSILNAVLKIADLRGRKATTGQKNWLKPEKTSEKVDSAIEKIKQIFDEDNKTNNHSSSGDPSDKKQKFEEAFEEFKQARQEEVFEKQKLIEELNMLRVLAGLGLVIGEFVHEVKRFLPGFDTDTKFLKKAVKDYSEALNRVERLEVNIKSFTAYTSYFDRAISRNVFRELEPIELRNAVNDFWDIVKKDIERSGIVFHQPMYEDFDLFTIPMHPSEWASILFNFYTNSKKAIRRKGVKGEIFIKCGRNKDNVYLEFSDNGDGINKDHEEQIFNAFYTTSGVSGHRDSDSESLSGTGLGLKILKDIIESYNGSIYVSSPEKKFNTTIRIELPENK